MSPDKLKLKEYAEGWITERQGTAIPGFLKLAYIFIVGGTFAYFLTYMYGETTNPDRGQLVRAMNAATEASAAPASAGVDVLDEPAQAALGRFASQQAQVAIGGQVVDMQSEGKVPDYETLHYSAFEALATLGTACLPRRGIRGDHPGGVQRPRRGNQRQRVATDFRVAGGEGLPHPGPAKDGFAIDLCAQTKP